MENEKKITVNIPKTSTILLTLAVVLQFILINNLQNEVDELHMYRTTDKAKIDSSEAKKQEELDMFHKNLENVFKKIQDKFDEIERRKANKLLY